MNYYYYNYCSNIASQIDVYYIGSYQLLTDGHPSLVLDKCSDYWDGNGLQTMCHTVSRKIKKKGGATNKRIKKR